MRHPPTLRALPVPAPRFAALPPAEPATHLCDVLVIGGGLAGLSAALRAAERADVILLARGALRESNSAWAQGGIAAALDPADTPRFHVEDTLIAGAGLCDEAAVEALANAAPALMRELACLGAPFEREGLCDDRFALGLEGGHSRRRIVHVGDATGWAVTKLLIERALAHPRIRVLEGFQAVDLLSARTQPAASLRVSRAQHGAPHHASDDQPTRCTGALALDAAGGWHRFQAGATILATGGAGALYGLTSNQPTALGEGIAMAYRAGAEVADMEFVQFHPTVFRTRSGQGFLISEAARGEGGILLTPAGTRFMPAYDRRGELAPRDVVTRGIFAAMLAEGCGHVLLDLRHLGRAFLERRFPTIMARCRDEGIDPAAAPIPVAPASHYLMGGVRTDLDGATSLPGLFAAGECACTGVHGANRLASNSLLECLVFGRRAGEAACEGRIQSDELRTAGARPSIAQSGVTPVGAEPDRVLAKLQQAMRAGAGPLRTAEGLRAALAQLDALEARQTPGTTQASVSEAVTAANALLAARLIVTGALLRAESRGGHFRADAPESRDEWRAHIIQARGRAPALAETIADTVGSQCAAIV